MLPSSLSTFSSTMKSGSGITTTNLRRRRRQLRETVNQDNVVVASQSLSDAYTSLAVSPRRRYAVGATADTLHMIRIDAESGLTNLHSLSCAGLFASATAAPSGTQSRGWRGAAAAGPPSGVVAVALNDVSWSPCTTSSNQTIEDDNNDDEFEGTWIAAGGSNGVILVWPAAALRQKGTTSPPVVLRQHHRAVNRVCWHPTDTGVFLSASQDGTVRLWQPTTVSSSSSNKGEQTNKRGTKSPPVSSSSSLWGHMFGPSFPPTSAAGSSSWTCTTTFEPKAEGVRDVAWHPMLSQYFACVTAGGTLVLYHRRVAVRSALKRTAHGREAATLDWHPRLPHIVATAGATDGTVKVWDVGSGLAYDTDMDTTGSIKSNPLLLANQNSHHAINSTHHNSQVNTSSFNSRTEFSDTSSDDVRASPLWWTNRTANSATSRSGGTSMSTSRPLHVLSVAASVTRVRWRPCSGQGQFGDESGETDRHDGLLCVATAPLGWMSASGAAAGVVGLWSIQRPYMALSVVEGHSEGAVVDFVWLDTPMDSSITIRPSGVGVGTGAKTENTPSGPSSLRSLVHRHSPDDSGGMDTSEHSRSFLEPSQAGGLWQHILSVGKDGRCLVQSLVRGDRPLARVPPSCFALANLSPFQSGYGSLQIFTIHQPVPSGPKHDYFLTGLRRDDVTAEAPGMFREIPSDAEFAAVDDQGSLSNVFLTARQLPPKAPTMLFHVLDQGDLDPASNLPVTTQPDAVTLAPEVLHMSRFAESYVLQPKTGLSTRASLCNHNSQVAEHLKCDQVAHLWATLGVILEGSSMDEFEQSGAIAANGKRGDGMHYIIYPTVHAMLEELAEEGDVQSCVAICEVLGVLNSDGTTKIEGLDITLVREWYLSYIDMLRDMCLFSFATEIIQRCIDPYIADANKTSTTIHEACPHCGKPQEAADTPGNQARRECKNCRRRIGMCFLCHRPVQGVYIWCPSCGHGGHIECAMSWFGGFSGKSVRDCCPTGCGHRFNRRQPISAFPRTDSLRLIDS